jgi:hypothetical protein
VEQALDDGRVATWEITGTELRAGPEGVAVSGDPNVQQLVSGTTGFRINLPSHSADQSVASIAVERVLPGGEVEEVVLPESVRFGQFGLVTLADGVGGLVGAIDSSTGALSRELWLLPAGAVEWRSARAPGWPMALSDTAVVVQSEERLFQQSLPFDGAADLLGAAVQGPWAQVGLRWSPLPESSRSAAEELVVQPPVRMASGLGYGGVQVDYVVGDPGERDRLVYAAGATVEVETAPSSGVELRPAVEGRIVLAVPDNQGTHKFLTVDPDGTVREVYALQPTEHPMVTERPAVPEWRCPPGSSASPRLFGAGNATVVLAGCGRLLWLGWGSSWEELGLPVGAEVVAVDHDVVLARIPAATGETDTETGWVARRIA